MLKSSHLGCAAKMINKKPARVRAFLVPSVARPWHRILAAVDYHGRASDQE